ncbi:hypothetical protein LCGC14_1253450 [marine sediment metagenome]|uniref:HEAT repeat domain-containing protein n=1 Tax=marine sediment metagenome TaxID=412755 RepID=A0A0F9NJD7_9ZZZZ
MFNIVNEYEEFQKCNDGQKMAMMEDFLVIALNDGNVVDWVRLFLQIAQTDSSPCVKHEAAFNTGQVFAKYDGGNELENISEEIAHGFCQIVENDESLVMKHETMESMGDAGFDTPEVRALLYKYSQDENYDVANTAQISYWQITGEGFD